MYRSAAFAGDRALFFSAHRREAAILFAHLILPVYAKFCPHIVSMLDVVCGAIQAFDDQSIFAEASAAVENTSVECYAPLGACGHSRRSSTEQLTREIITRPDAIADN